MGLFSTVPGSTWLYLTLPDCARLYLALPWSTMIYHSRLPHTVTDWPKCFGIYRLKCSKAISGWVGWVDGNLCKHLCGSNKRVFENWMI